MDYSVGSLADLITGSNTPNKPKVVQKAFKKNTKLDLIKSKSIKKKVDDENASESSHIDNRNSKIKKNKKQADVDQNASENSHIKKNKLLKKNRKTLKSESIENEQDAELDAGLLPIKKNKGKKSKLNVNKNNASSTEDIIEVSGRKRKSDESASNFLDSDEESPAKKEKTDFQQNAERRVKKKVNEEKKAQNPEELSRTIFVGNVPIKIEKKKIKKHFKKYGIIETVRIRGIPVADPKISKKTAAIKKEYNPNRSNVYCYIRFENKEDALKAEAENGVLFEGHHLRVHSCDSDEKPDETKAIFVGNLSFDAVEDELWNLFEPCGPISYVRIIRDSYTGMGKGFAYVNFKDSDAVQLALEMENVKLKDRELRIALSNLNVARKNKKFNKKKIAQAGKQKFNKPFNKNSDEKTSGSPRGKTTATNAEFQGTKFNDKKKKHKLNKGLLEKKKLVKKIAPRVK